MKIFEPRVFDEGDEVCISARVEVDSVRSRLPNELWFRFPVEYKDCLSDQSNGFVVALLPLAMTFGEDIHVDGELSPRLLRGMEEYQRVQKVWKPTTYQPVGIHCDRLQPEHVIKERSGVGSSFSGGVDSFDTLWRHLPENEPLRDFRVTHTLMINGFDADTDLDNQGHFSRIRDSIEPMMEQHGVKLIICRTNYGQFTDPEIIKNGFAAMVTVPALVLGRMFTRFFIPSSYRFDEFLRDGSHLTFDHLIATESMETVHEGSYLQRPEKTENISDWSATYPLLRVCFNATRFDEDTGSIMNCSRCEKCVRTMTTLKILGKLENYTVFSKTPGHLDIWKCHFPQKSSRVHAKEVMSFAWKAGKPGICLDYCIAFAISLVALFPRKLLRNTHLWLEQRSEFYAVQIRRLFPRLRRRAYWIR